MEGSGADMTAERRPPGRSKGVTQQRRLELQVLLLQSGIAAFFCAGAAAGFFGLQGAPRWLSIGWVGGYHLLHALYILRYRAAGRPVAWIEAATPALDVSCITTAWLALDQPDSAFWAVYLYALVGYARRIHGRNYAVLAIFIIANMAIGRMVIIGGSPGEAIDANLVTMVALGGAMALLASATGTAWRTAERHARALADIDHLTGLANRRTFLEWLEHEAEDPRAAFTVLMLDMDDFKRLNDQEGHIYGDNVLVSVARLLEGCLRDGDRLARYGGEEFVVALPDTAPAETERIADRLRQAVANSAPTTVSIGCAERAPGESAASVLRRADDLLLQAKRLGKNVVRTHSRIVETAA